MLRAFCGRVFGGCSRGVVPYGNLCWLRQEARVLRRVHLAAVPPVRQQLLCSLLRAAPGRRDGAVRVDLSGVQRVWRLDIGARTLPRRLSRMIGPGRFGPFVAAPGPHLRLAACTALNRPKADHRSRVVLRITGRRQGPDPVLDLSPATGRARRMRKPPGSRSRVAFS